MVMPEIFMIYHVHFENIYIYIYRNQIYNPQKNNNLSRLFLSSLYLHVFILMDLL
jgi:hypothetical protein